MLVVSDVDDVFLPKPTDLLLSLTEQRTQIETLISRIPQMFADNYVVGNALGPALQAASKMMVGSSHDRDPVPKLTQ
jgi:protein transport protein SEC24